MRLLNLSTLYSKASGKDEAKKNFGTKKLMSFRFLLIAVLISITTGVFFIACSAENDLEGLEVSTNEKSLNLKAPNGEKIADNILQLKEIVSVSVAERFGIDKDFDITSLEYAPVKDGYAVLIKYRTLDDIKGGIVRTNSPSILEADGIKPITIRLKAGTENTAIFNGISYTCRPTPSTSDCDCTPVINSIQVGGVLVSTVDCLRSPYTCTGGCERIPPRSQSLP
jgi:hypothetical protein